MEGAAIDLLMSFPIVPASTGAHRPLERPAELTNARRESSRGHGIVLLDRLIDDFAAPVLTAEVPLLLITLGAWTDHDGEVLQVDGLDTALDSSERGTTRCCALPRSA